MEGFKNGQARDSEERLVEPIEGDGKKPPRLMPGVMFGWSHDGKQN